TLTTTTDCNCGAKCSLGGKVSARWAHPSGFNLDKLEVKGNGSVAVETSLTDVAPGVKFEFKGDDQCKSDLGVQYKHEMATANVEFDVAEFSAVNASVLAGSGAFTGGASTTLTLGDRMDLTRFDFAASYSVAKELFAGLHITNKFSKYALSLGYFACPKYQLAGVFNFTPEKSATHLVFGGSYKCNPDTTVKAKADSDGVLGLSVKQMLSSNCSITTAAQVPSSDFSAYKLGISGSIG
ncbi:unnamed protein product, partial [Symbiodinium microadriaticum]